MPVPTAPSPLLARLRRSTRLAVFMALVMVTKLVGSYACLSEEARGVANGQATQKTATLDASFHTSVLSSTADHADPQSAHHAGSCCHCSCHQVTTLPGSVAVTQMQLRQPSLPTTATLSIPTRLERELRPPIV